jgi:pimeloyl-ACP methyl ester carboxylesterase
MKLQRVRPFGLCALALAGGCAYETPEIVSNAEAPVAVFDPDEGDLPLPNDLLFDESADGTLNIDPDEDPDKQLLVDSLSSLDGWSTVAPVRFPFSHELDPASLQLGSSVRMFEVELRTEEAFVGAPVKSILRELAADEIEVARAHDGRGIVITPRRPLEPETSYTAVVTRDVRAAMGENVAPSLFLDLALFGETVAPSSELYPLQSRVQAELEALAGYGLSVDDVAVTTTFTTQSIDSVQKALVAIAKGTEDDFVAQLQVEKPYLDFSQPLADAAPAPSVGIEGLVAIELPEEVEGLLEWTSQFHRGWVDLPYYLDASVESSLPQHDDAPITSRFHARFPFGPDDEERHTTRFNPLPATKSVQRVPLLVCEPLYEQPTGFIVEKPESGWPVVVFQHGITQNRGNLLGLSFGLGLAGYVGVAIDLPLHGIVDETDPLFAGLDSGIDGVRERHFGLDLLTEFEDEELDPIDGSDGIVDSSGEHFVQLSSVFTTRDNIKQAVADLLQLREVLDQIDLDGDGIPDLDTSDVHFVGHSLGAIVGAQYLAFTEDYQSATLGMPGGGLVGLLYGSEVFGPEVISGLAEKDIYPDTDDFFGFVDIAQSVTDSSDPINHAKALGAQTTPLQLIEVIGATDPITGVVVNPPDDTVPNVVEGFPLSGTEPLIEAIGLPKVTQSMLAAPTIEAPPTAKSFIDASGIRAAMRYTDGDHASLLIASDFDDIELVEVYITMLYQAVSFISTSGSEALFFSSEYLED